MKTLPQGLKPRDLIAAASGTSEAVPFQNRASRNEFLGMFAIAAIVLTSALGHAQIEVPGPMHLAHIRGVVVTAKGEPIQGADVTLVRNDKVVAETKTDAAGKFAFKHVSGRFWLRMHPAGYALVNRQVVIGEVASYLHTNTLYVIAGPGACMDDCAQVFTSRTDFERAIRRNKGQL